mgnify:CR=1 FL=1
MFKKILIGTFLGYIVSSIFLVIYHFLFGGYTYFLDGDFTRYDFSTILPSLLGYLVLTFAFFLVGFIYYFLICKIFSYFNKNKINIKNKLMYYSSFYIFISIIYMEYIDGYKLIKDRKSTRLNSSHITLYRMPSSA